MPVHRPTHLASGRGFLGLSWWESEGRCCCCRLASWGNCCWESEETGGCWAAGTSLEKWRCVACEAHSVPGCGTELRGCAEGYIRCVVEPAPEEELQVGKENTRKTNMRMIKICNNTARKLELRLLSDDKLSGGCPLLAQNHDSSGTVLYCTTVPSDPRMACLETGGKIHPLG